MTIMFRYIVHTMSICLILVGVSIYIGISLFPPHITHKPDRLQHNPQVARSEVYHDQANNSGIKNLVAIRKDKARNKQLLNPTEKP